MTDTLTRAMVDALAPEHSVLRYQTEPICTDNDRRGGFDSKFRDKEWRCKRCCLLQIVDGHWLVPDGVEVALEVYGSENIK